MRNLCEESQRKTDEARQRLDSLAAELERQRGVMRQLHTLAEALGPQPGPEALPPAMRRELDTQLRQIDDIVRPFTHQAKAPRRAGRRSMV